MVYNKKFYEMQHAENLRNKLMTDKDKQKSKKLLEKKREYNKNGEQSMIII